MSISPTQQKTIQDFCLSEPRTIKQIAERLKLKGSKALMSLYNYLKTNIAKSLFMFEKLDGLLFIRSNPLSFQNPVTKKLDLILNKQNRPETKNASGKTYERIEGLKRAGPERLEGILKLNRINKFGYYNKSNQEFVYTNNIKTELDDLFHTYCARVQNEKIIMSLSPGGSQGSPVLAQDHFFSFQTRFTSPARQKEIKESFEAAYQRASSKHMKGVFLTLTSQPVGSLWEINQRSLKAWEKFRKLLNRVLPARADWLKVCEFQKNGMIHFHVLILGVNWLLHKSVLQYTWKKYGGGPIMDIHTIKNEPLTGWAWARSCPLEAAGIPLKDFLSRYLEKSMSPQAGALYWAIGCRYWTCSKSLYPKEKPESRPSRYILKGVMGSQGFRASHRKDSIEFFKPGPKPGGSLNLVKAATLAYIHSCR